MFICGLLLTEFELLSKYLSNKPMVHTPDESADN